MQFLSVAALAVSAVIAHTTVMDAANPTSSTTNTTTTATTANSTTKKGSDDRKTKSDSDDGIVVKVYVGPSTAAPIPIYSTAAPIITSKPVVTTPCSSPVPTATAAPAIVDPVVTSTPAPYLPLPTATQTPSPYITVSPEAIDGVPMGYKDASSPVAQETLMPILSTGDIVSSSFAAGVCAAVAFLAL